MRKLIFCAVGLIGVIGLAYFPSAARGEDPPEAGGSTTPQRIALIDLSVIFKKYGKFNRLREDLKHKLEQKESEAKAMYTEIQRINNTLKSGTLKSGSPEYIAQEKELTQLMANLEAHKKQAQMELAREEAGIYHQMNKEINNMVKRVAKDKRYNYSLVMRFSREDLSSTDPKNVAKELSRQILYYNESDDISDTVAHFLNHFDKSNPAKSPKAEAVRQTGGVRDE